MRGPDAGLAQRISAITNPGSDTYTPSSGIWQTVWLENVPSAYIGDIKILTDTRRLTLTVIAAGDSVPATFDFSVSDNGTVVLKGQGVPGEPLTVYVPNAKTWSPDSPFLYDLAVVLGSDSVASYFGLRSIELAPERRPASKPQAGVDHPLGDLPGMPIVMQSNDPSQCAALCQSTALCVAWALVEANCRPGVHRGVGPRAGSPTLTPGVRRADEPAQLLPQGRTHGGRSG